MLHQQIARLRLLGIVFCLGGGAVITAGWAGTAGVACVDCQVPYLLSGGAAGIALTIVGVGLLVIAQLRFEGHRIVERISAQSAGPADARPDDPAAGTADARPASPDETARLDLTAALPSSRPGDPEPAQTPR